MTFLTKKGQDFQAFKTICRVVHNGAYKNDEIKRIMLKLSYTMNNYRLSSWPDQVNILSKNEYIKLINATPIFEYLNKGRVRDIETKKIINQQVSSVYEINKPIGEILVIQTLSEAAVAIGVDSGTLSRHLEVENLKGRPIELKGNKVIRLPIYKAKITKV